MARYFRLIDAASGSWSTAHVIAPESFGQVQAVVLRKEYAPCKRTSSLRLAAFLVAAGSGIRAADGAVLRCANCDTALIRITHIRGSYWLDLSGTRCLRIAADN